MVAVAKVPRIAVVLPVYNGEKYLAEAIRSVLAQTFEDFELVAIDDGSSDRTAEILSAFSDSRLRVIRFPEHRGLVEALNCGIRESRSELIARMDADDICLPRRFERQVAFLDAHPQVALCGTWTRQFGNGARGILHLPAESKQIRAQLFFGGAIDHPSIMMRRAFLERHGLAYDEKFRHVEDFDFFIRAAELAPLANLPEVLLRTREHDNNVSRVYRKEQVQAEARLFARQLRSLIPDATQEQEDFHVRIATEAVEASDLARVDQWLLHLDQVNRESARYDPGAFRHELQRRSYALHAYTIPAGLPVLMSYWKSPLAGIHGNRVRECATLARALLIARLLDARWACEDGLRRHKADKLPEK